jgi:hypothetical protein
VVARPSPDFLAEEKKTPAAGWLRQGHEVCHETITHAEFYQEGIGRAMASQVLRMFTQGEPQL